MWIFLSVFRTFITWRLFVDFIKEIQSDLNTLFFKNDYLKQIGINAKDTAEIMIKKFIQQYITIKNDYNNKASCSVFSQKEYEDYNTLFLLLIKKFNTELVNIENIIVELEDKISCFDIESYSFIKDIYQRLYSIKIFFPIASEYDFENYISILIRLLSIELYFRKKSSDYLIEILKSIEEHNHKISDGIFLFIKILIYLVENFDKRLVSELDNFIYQLENTTYKNTEEISCYLLLKALLIYYRGKLSTVLDIYEKYLTIPITNYPFLHEYFSLKVSLAAMTLSNYHISYGIISSFKNTAQLTKKTYVRLRWVLHLSFLFGHRGNFKEVKKYLDEAKIILCHVSDPVPLCFYYRSEASYYYHTGDYIKAATILKQSAISFSDNELVAPIVDPRMMFMLYELECTYHLDIGKYSLKNMLLSWQKSVSSLSQAVYYKIQADLLDQEKDKVTVEKLLEKALNEIVYTGYAPLIEEIGNRLMMISKKSIESIIVPLNKNYNNIKQTDPFYFSLNCLKELTTIHNEDNFNINMFLFTLQKELGAQRIAFFEVDKTNKVCIASINITSVEIEEFSFKNIQSNIYAFLEKKLGIPEVVSINETILTFLFPKGLESCYVLYLENDLKEGIFLSMGNSEKNAIAWFLYSEIKNNLSKIINQNHLNLSYIGMSEPIKSMPPYFGPDFFEIINKIDFISHTDMPIIIYGETGTGKEQLARYIHKLCCPTMPFISVHLASISENLFESELFGYEKGAFTGALQQKKGVIELAHNGILFLDEIGEVPLSMQVKLLRVLQDKHFTRVGGTESLFSNFRLISATNKNLLEEVKKGNFREDLFYRLSMFPLNLPPLRERKRDFPQLVNQLYSFFCSKYHKKISSISVGDYKILENYLWPGNVRELASVIEKFVVFGKIEINSNRINLVQDKKDINEFLNETVFKEKNLLSLEELEKKYINYVLDKTNGKIYGKNGALEILGMKKSTFYNKIAKYK